MAFYRVTLPAIPADPAGSHAGEWQAILALKDRAEIDKLLKNREFATLFKNAAIGESLPYSLIAHAYSNLKFEARLQQDSLKPGAVVTLAASLRLYGVPFADDATVWAEVSKPDLTTENLMLARVAEGSYTTSFVASLPGVYPCRVRAEGYFRSKDKFTREKTLTAATYYGEGPGSSGDDPWCDLLHCLTSDKVLTKLAAEKLRKLGVNVESLRKCVEKHCPEPKEPVRPKPAGRRLKPTTAKPGVNIASLPKARPVKLPVVKPMSTTKPTPLQGPRIVHMFTRPEELEPGMNRPPDGMPAATGHVFPRIVRMFTHPDEIAGGKDEPDKK